MTEGTVRISGLNLRAGITPGEVVKALRKSSRLEILGEETWLRVRTRDGKEGYVFGDFVDRDAPTNAELSVLGSTRTPACVLERYLHGRFVGSPLTADRDFFGALDRIGGFAEATGLLVHVTSSVRDPGGNVSGAIVSPAKRSNHLVGHAIDMNLRAADGRLFNSTMLRDLAAQPAPVRRFIELVRKDGDLRWGGDFNPRDPVHIDDGLNAKHPAVWLNKLASRQGA